MTSCFSLVSLYGRYLHRCYKSFGLSRQILDVDSETTISFWAPTPNSHHSDKPSLVFLHGFGPGATWQWKYQLETLSPYFNLYIPDFVFFGDSTTKSTERSEVFQARSVGKLLEKLGVERYSVMGTSYGGFVAYNMAKLLGERVEKVVIASSGMNRTWKDHLKLLERAKVEKVEDLMLPRNPSQLRNLMRVAMGKSLPNMPDFFLNDYINTLYSDNLEEKSELLRGLTFGKDDIIHVSPIQQEVLIIWGEHDQIFPLEKAVELQGILGDKARLEVIKNTSHVPQFEDPKKFNEIVLKFLCGGEYTLRCQEGGLIKGGLKKGKAS